MDKKNMAMYSEAHDSYDLTNHLLSFFADSSMRRMVAKEILGHNPKRVLDIATGTGDTAIITAKLGGASVDVTAIDANRLMLSTATEKACKAGVRNVHFRKGDAMRLGYPNGYFDAVSITFALKNMESLERFAAESYRVLRKGGRLVIADISMPKGGFNRLMFNVYSGYMGIVGRMTGKKLYKWLPGSTRAFDKDSFMELMKKRGFTRTREHDRLFRIAYILTYTK